jgi:GNAT superfamily N-acetyltransferase
MTALVRRARAGDGPALAAMHGRCSPDSRRRRWLAPLGEIPRRYLAAVLAGTPDHVALVAETADGRLVGLASAARSGPAWDLGVLVEDAEQHRGVGTALLDELIGGLGAGALLSADALLTNRHVLDRLTRHGPVSVREERGVAHATVLVTQASRTETCSAAGSAASAPTSKP